MEAVAERPDGRRVPFIPYPTPIFNASGVFIGAVNMLVDISDINGVITSWNRAAERLFGYLAEEVIGKPITIIIPADRQDEEPVIIERIRRGERIDHYETMRQRKDGSLIDVSLSVSTIRDETGRVVGAAKIARDITERKRRRLPKKPSTAPAISSRPSARRSSCHGLRAQTILSAPYRDASARLPMSIRSSPARAGRALSCMISLVRSFLHTANRAMGELSWRVRSACWNQTKRRRWRSPCISSPPTPQNTVHFPFLVAKSGSNGRAVQTVR
jgi:PAS domain S-box-containing protein